MQSFKWRLPVTTLLTSGQNASCMSHQPRQNKRFIDEWFFVIVFVIIVFVILTVIIIVKWMVSALCCRFRRNGVAGDSPLKHQGLYGGVSFRNRFEREALKEQTRDETSVLQAWSLSYGELAVLSQCHRVGGLPYKKQALQRSPVKMSFLVHELCALHDTAMPYQ